MERDMKGFIKRENITPTQTKSDKRKGTKKK